MKATVIEPICHSFYIAQVASKDKSVIRFHMNTNTSDYDCLEGSVSDYAVHT